MSNGMRTVSFIDRFGRKHVFLFLLHSLEARCVEAYKELWPKVKRHLAVIGDATERLKEVVSG